MCDKKPLNVDLKQKKAFLQVVPNTESVTIHEAQWNNIGVVYYYMPPLETSECNLKQHCIAIHLRQKSGSERKLGQHRQFENTNVGDIAIIPANVNHWVANVEESEGLLVFLEPQKISHIAYELINPDNIEFTPHFSQADALIYGIGLALKAELESTRGNDYLYIESLRNTLSMHLIRKYTGRQYKLHDTKNGLSNKLLQQVIEYINANLDQKLRVADLAEVVSMSQYYFSHLFKQSMGIAPHQYLIQQRVEQAKQLLKQSNLSIAEIAVIYGFVHQSHFAHHFKRVTGITPAAFRAE